MLTASIITAGILQSANEETYINLETGVAQISGVLQTISDDISGNKYNVKISGGSVQFLKNGNQVGTIYVDVGGNITAQLNGVWIIGENGVPFEALSTSDNALEIGNLGSLYIGGIGGTVAWKTVEIVGGGTALALCKV